MKAKTLRCGAMVLLMGALAGGCTAIIDSSKYVGTDGGLLDAQVDPDVPSTPEIELRPKAPRTADTLTVAITAESVDPLSGTVEYEYRWLRDGSVVDDATGTSIDPALTAKGETWRVEVTPVAMPGARRGTPALAEVMIGNTPATLETVGLESYLPRVGETLRALAGPVRDADGDSTTLRFQWFADDSPIDGASSPALPTDSHPPGTEIRLEAWADDGERGPIVSVGPVRLAPDVTHWRQVLPDLSTGLARVVWDAENARAVRIVDGGAWEYTLAPDGLRVTQLAPRGTPPDDDEIGLYVHDELHQRLLVITESDRTAVYALDLSRRGGESWTRIDTGGPPPDLQMLSVSHFDATNERVWVFGGHDDADEVGALDQVFSLDISTPGAESWTRHTPDGAFPRVFGAAVAADPTVPGRAYLVGGLTTPAPSTIVARDQIVQLDLTDTDITVTELPTRLPTTAWASVAAPDPSTGTILLVGGVTTFGATATPLGVLRFDPRAGSVTSLVDADTDATVFGTLRPDAHVSGAFIAISQFGNLLSEELSLGVYRVTSEGMTRIAAEERPARLHEAFGVIEADTIRVLGGREQSAARTESWTVDVTTWRWSRLTTRDDIISATSPQPRFGVLVQTSDGGFAGNELVMVGGSLAEGALADMQVWRLRDDQRWLQHTLRDGVAAIAPRTAHAVFGVSCGHGRVGVFGGMDASGNLYGETAVLECSSDRTCEWSTDVTGDPSPRRHAPVVQTFSSATWLFGGRDATGSRSDVHVLDSCASPAQWTAITPTGTAPAARHGHSAVVVRGTSGAFESILYFGGQTDDVNVALNDVARLVVHDATTASWEAVAVEGASPSPRAHHLAFWDPTRNRMLIIGGNDPARGPRSDVWELRIRP